MEIQSEPNAAGTLAQPVVAAVKPAKYGVITHLTIKAGHFRSERAAQIFLILLSLVCLSLSAIIFYLTFKVYY